MPRPDAELRSRDLAQMIAELTITEEQPTSWTTFSSRLVTMQDSLFIGDVEWSWRVVDPITGEPVDPRAPITPAGPAASGSIRYPPDYTIHEGPVTLGVADSKEPSTAPIVVVRDDPLMPGTDQRLGLTHTASPGPYASIMADNTSPVGGDLVVVTWTFDAGSAVRVFYFDDGSDVELEPPPTPSPVDPYSAPTGTYRTYVIEATLGGRVTTRVVAVRWGRQPGPNIQVVVPLVDPLPGETSDIGWTAGQEVVVTVEGAPVVPTPLEQLIARVSVETRIGRVYVRVPRPVQAVPPASEVLVGRINVGPLVGVVDAPVITEQLVGRVDVHILLSRIIVGEFLDRIQVEARIGRTYVAVLVSRIHVEVRVARIHVEVPISSIPVETLLWRTLVFPEFPVGSVEVEARIARIAVEVPLSQSPVEVLLSRIPVPAFVARVPVEVDLGRVYLDRLVGRIQVDQRIGTIPVEAFIGRVEVEVEVGRVPLLLTLAEFVVPTGQMTVMLALLQAGAAPGAFAQSPFAPSGTLLDGDLLFTPTGSTLVRIRNTPTLPILNFNGGSSIGAYLQAGEGRDVVAWYQRRGDLFNDNLFNSIAGGGFTSLTLFTSGVPSWLSQLTEGERFIIAFTLPTT